MTPQSQGTGTESAGRVADVLLAFTHGHPSMGVSAIARELDLSKAVVHRILQSLVSRDFLVFDAESREYRLGPAASVLGGKALRQLDLRTAARDELIRLRDLTAETTTLSVLFGDRRAYVDQYEGPHEISMKVELGQSHQLHAGGSSLAILAHVPDDVAARAIEAGLPALTPTTITGREELYEELQRIRERGYAKSRGERRADAGSVAAPVFGIHGVVGSVSACGPIGRFDEATCDRLGPIVAASAARISEQLRAQL